MYKAIFSDMDSTLLCDDKSICRRNIDAIQRAEKLGVRFVLCTGRAIYGVTQFSDIINTSNVIVTNGSIIYSNGKKIRNNHLDKKDALKIIDYAIKNDLYLRVFEENCLYCMNYENNPVKSNYYSAVKNVSTQEALQIASSKTIVKMGFFQSHERCLKIREDLNKMDVKVDALFSGTKFLDVIVKGDDKGAGIKCFCDHNNIDLRETIGVGDEENDYLMLRTVGLACAPSNATTQIKNICKFVTKANNNEGAIGEIIDKYIFNKCS